MMPFSATRLLLAIGVFAGPAQPPLPIVVFATEKGSIEMDVRPSDGRRGIT
jgi:hypothetical protein